jgi:hypothetical protein
LRTIRLVSAGFAAATPDVALIIVNSSQVREKYHLNDYHSNHLHHIMTKHQNTSDGAGNILQAQFAHARNARAYITP